MRVTSIEKFTITRQEIADKLKIDVSLMHSIERKEDCFKVELKEKKNRLDRSIFIYLRCSDMKKLFDLDLNILDQKHLLVEKGMNIVYYKEVEAVRSTARLGKLRRIIAKLTK